jgi:hypothetical protein
LRRRSDAQALRVLDLGQALLDFREGHERAAFTGRGLMNSCLSFREVIQGRRSGSQRSGRSSGQARRRAIAPRSAAAARHAVSIRPSSSAQ